MSTVPSVSVVVPVRNGAGTIADLLEALLRGQSSPPANMEVVVVDNGSTDGTREIVRGRSVTLLEEPNPGPAAARNRGLHHASGEVVAYLDADTLPTRRWLVELVAPFADPQVVLVAGRTLSYPPETPAERYVAASGLYETERAIRRHPFPFAPSLNLAVRREDALAIDGWAEDMMTAEDVDFSFRLLRRRHTEIGYQPGAVLFHRHRPTDDGLRRQAWTYGAGAAHMYLRYPDVVRWDLRKTLTVAGRLGARTTLPALLGLGRRLRLASPKQVEFARYQRLWTWWFWRGFASMYRHGEGRQL